jgi:hypothetical protein
METNNLQDLYGSYNHYHDNVTRKIVGSVHWNDPQLKKVTRLRLLSDPGFPAWDVSYCHGTLKNGDNVDVLLPFSQLPKRNINGAIIAHAKRDKVYAKGLGIFDCISCLC